MLRSFCLLLVCQLLGEVFVRSTHLPVPGPLAGLVLLLACLAAASRFGLIPAEGIDATPLGRTAAALIGILGLLFVPAGAGVIQNVQLLAANGLALAAALVLSTVLTLLVTVLVFTGTARLIGKGDHD
jgi:holin-like protein